jgi:hypothetical protein
MSRFRVFTALFFIIRLWRRLYESQNRFHFDCRIAVLDLFDTEHPSGHLASVFLGDIHVPNYSHTFGHACGIHLRIYCGESDWKALNTQKYGLSFQIPTMFSLENLLFDSGTPEVYTLLPTL